MSNPCLKFSNGFISKQSELPVVAYTLPDMDPWLPRGPHLILNHFLLCSSHTGLLFLPQALCICRSRCLEYSSYRSSQGWPFSPFKFQVQYSLTIYAKKTIFSSSHLKFCIMLFHCHIRVVIFFYFYLFAFWFLCLPIRIHSLKQILNTYYVPGTDNTSVNKADKNPCTHRAYIPECEIYEKRTPFCSLLYPRGL